MNKRSAWLGVLKTEMQIEILDVFLLFFRKTFSLNIENHVRFLTNSFRNISPIINAYRWELIQVFWYGYKNPSFKW